MASVVAVLSTIVGVGATLCMLVMLMAGGANAKPAAITQLKWLMVSVAVVGLASVIAAVWAFVHHRHWLSAGLGIAPLVYAIVLVIVLVQLEW